MIGIIGGTGFQELEFLQDTKKKKIATDYGDANVFFGDKFLFVSRHGENSDIPPHRINHRANIMALKKLDANGIVGIASVGSLNKKIPPKSIVIPDDYINLWNIPTFFDSEVVHITPELDVNLREMIISAAKRLGVDIIDKGIYFQTSGPRLETKAEINLLKDYADIVGMNMASEATLAKEKGIRYANISLVDNYAHGISDEILDFQEISKKPFRKDLEKLLLAIVEMQ